jgi:hypothetical protein
MLPYRAASVIVNRTLSKAPPRHDDASTLETPYDLCGPIDEVYSIGVCNGDSLTRRLEHLEVTRYCMRCQLSAM